MKTLLLAILFLSPLVSYSATKFVHCGAGEKDFSLGMLVPSDIWIDIESPFKVYIDEVRAIGFSKDGKFAYSECYLSAEDGKWTVDSRITDLVADTYVRNIVQSDTNALTQNGIDIHQKLEMGKFPIDQNGDQYSVVITTRPDDYYDGKVDKYVVWLHSKVRGKKEIGTISAFHVQCPPRAVAYLKSPFEDRIAVVVGSPYMTPGDTDIREISHAVFGAHLKVGFKK